MVGRTSELTRYVPRLVAEWVRDEPDRRHRAIPGTMVMSDLSGFTAMSERLAAAGKAGAEELTYHLDEVFSPMLTVAAQLGGSLLKFGGDALLLFFWGDGHERRGAAACHRMQRTLRRVGLISTSAGRIRLGASMGAHAGLFDFFLVGDSHRELLVCGPDASATVAAEAGAGTGEVLVSSALAKTLGDRRLLGTRKGGGVLLASPPRVTADAAVEEVAWPKGSSPAHFVPALLREELAGGTVVPEHRQMAVSFLHLPNVDEMLTTEGPDVTARALDELLGAIQRVFDHHGVGFISTDVYDGGPKVIGATGAVRSWENDDERLLRALREISDLDSPIERRASAHRGHAFRGPIGTPFRQTFAVMGDVVNTSARVMAKAAAGELLATPAVVERSGTLFTTEELPPFAAKGKTEPLVALRIGAITGERTRTAQRRSPLVGREDEVAGLIDRASSALRGEAELVEVVGDAGLGKTRLFDEVVERLDGVEVVRTSCTAYAQAAPFSSVRPLLQAALGGDSLRHLRRVVRDRAPGLSPWLSLLAIPLDLTVKPSEEVRRLDPDVVAGRLHGAVGDLLATVLTAPTVWVIEDTHWADEAARALLSALSPRLADLGLAVVVSRRPHAPPLEGTAASLSLEPLGLDAAEQIVRAAAPRPLLPELVDELATRAAGNPLFLEELAAAVSEGQTDLPETVEGVIAARIDALSASDRQVVRHLAVLGTTTDLATARAMVDGLPAAKDSRRWSTLSGFVEKRGNDLRFRHAMVRDVAYQGLSFRSRRLVHLAAGRFLEATDDAAPELLALHFSEGGDRERALRYSVAAASAAEQRYAFAEAATLWERAGRALGPRDPSGVDVFEHHGEALQRSGRYREAEVAFRRARRLARRSSPDRLPEVAHKIGTVIDYTGRPEVAARWYRRGLRELEGSPEPLCRARILTALAEQYDDIGRNRAAIELAEQALEELGDAESSLGPDDQASETLARAIALRYRVGLRGHDRSVATRESDITRRLRRLGQDRVLCAHLVDAAVARKQRGDWAGATTAYSEAAKLSRKTGHPMNEALVQNNLGELLFARGLIGQSLEAFSAAFDAFEAAGVWQAGVVALGLGRARAAAGDVASGGIAVEQGRKRLAAAGIPLFDEVAELIAAEIDLREGGVDAAQRRLEPLVASADDDVRLPAMRLRALAVAQSDPEGAATACEEAVTAARKADRPYELGMSLDALARLTGDLGAASEAAEVFHRLGVVSAPHADLSWTSAGR